MSNVLPQYAALFAPTACAYAGMSNAVAIHSRCCSLGVLCGSTPNQMMLAFEVSSQHGGGVLHGLAGDHCRFVGPMLPAYRGSEVRNAQKQRQGGVLYLVALQ